MRGIMSTLSKSKLSMLCGLPGLLRARTVKPSWQHFDQLARFGVARHDVGENEIVVDFEREAALAAPCVT